MYGDWFDDQVPPVTPAPHAPRARRRPSERNLRIHELVCLRHERQEDVAAQYGLTQQRVSAICSQVQAWDKWQLASPDFEALEADQRRQQLLECRARDETVLVLALRGAVAERKSLVSTKRVTTAEGVQETRTERGVPGNPAWLKIVRGSSQSIARINAELGIAGQTSALAEEIERLWGELL